MTPKAISYLSLLLSKNNSADRKDIVDEIYGNKPTSLTEEEQKWIKCEKRYYYRTYDEVEDDEEYY